MRGCQIPRLCQGGPTVDDPSIAGDNLRTESLLARLQVLDEPSRSLGDGIGAGIEGLSTQLG